MLQQNLYNENNRYIKWTLKNQEHFFELDSIVIGICLVGFFVIYDLANFSILCLLIMSALLLYVGSKKRNEILTDQNKKKLVVTARIKRLIFTITILFLIPLLYLGFHITDSKICWLVY